MVHYVPKLVNLKVLSSTFSEPRRNLFLFKETVKSFLSTNFKFDASLILHSSLPSFATSNRPSNIWVSVRGNFILRWVPFVFLRESLVLKTTLKTPGLTSSLIFSLLMKIVSWWVIGGACQGFLFFSLIYIIYSLNLLAWAIYCYASCLKCSICSFFFNYFEVSNNFLALSLCSSNLEFSSSTISLNTIVEINQVRITLESSRIVKTKYNCWGNSGF